MKLKRVVPIVMSLAMFGGSLGMFAGCTGGDPNTHDHDYDGQPIVNGGESGHYQQCKVEGCTEKKTVPHTYNNAGATCDSCDFANPNYVVHHHTWEGTKTDTTHDMHCTECTETKVGAHSFEHFEETCDYCDFANPAFADTSSGSSGGASCEHTLDESKWTAAGAAGHYHRATCEHKEQHSEIQPHSLTGGECSECSYVEVTYSTPTATDNSTKFNGSIYVVGDSTVCDFSDDYYLPRRGYGTELATYLNVEASQVKNYAMSGRSSKSYTTEAEYNTVKNGLTAGDYLIIGFGHNDEKNAEPARFCDPAGTKDTENTSKGTSFKWSLYEKYIKVAQAAGATPILCTPIVRYDDSGNYTGSKVHVTGDGDYAQAIIELGEEVNVPVIDLTGATKREYLNDVDGAAYYHAHTKYYIATNDDIKSSYDGTERPVGKDDTHINKYGAKMVAYNFAQLLLQTDCELKNSVKTNMSHPTKESDYLGAIKQSYVLKAYTPFNAAANAGSKLATVYTDYTKSDWYKSYMGVGSSGHTATYSNGKFTLTSGASSKFASGQDGFGAVFTQINIKKNFIASVKAKVTSAPDNVGTSDQNAFGLMLRDDILMNTVDTALNSNFVTAGLNGRGKFAFSRSSAASLTFSGKTTTFAKDKEYTFTIERIGQTVNVSVNNGTSTVTHKFTDFDFVARDTNYMYLCLFANRSLTVEFTELTYKVTGLSQGA